MKFYALTTKDNPYDVFDDYINWMHFDHQKGYNTSEFLARIARTSDNLSEEENQKEIERAIDEIISLHDGSLEIDNAVGGGCCVVIRLPVKDKNARQ